MCRSICVRLVCIPDEVSEAFRRVGKWRKRTGARGLRAPQPCRQNQWDIDISMLDARHAMKSTYHLVAACGMVHNTTVSREPASARATMILVVEWNQRMLGAHTEWDVTHPGKGTRCTRSSLPIQSKRHGGDGDIPKRDQERVDPRNETSDDDRVKQ